MGRTPGPAHHRAPRLVLCTERCWRASPRSSRTPAPKSSHLARLPPAARWLSCPGIIGVMLNPAVRVGERVVLPLCGVKVDIVIVEGGPAGRVSPSAQTSLRPTPAKSAAPSLKSSMCHLQPGRAPARSCACLFRGFPGRGGGDVGEDGSDDGLVSGVGEVWARPGARSPFRMARSAVASGARSLSSSRPVSTWLTWPAAA